MTKSMMAAIIAAIKRIRAAATDETALDSIDIYPVWKVNTPYTAGDRYRHEGVLYRCVQSHTSQAGWEPDKTPALWAVVSLEEWPEWVQPVGSSDAYAKGDKVSYQDKHWVSDVDRNVWAPGVYGWTEVV